MIRNSRGQTAIFIALIFQILFVLFAMTINVALVVHDKINLQNAVDLAAYYAAERQAEHLNAIAHINYQIRQSWKLLAWRYRFFSTMGFDRPANIHPARSGVVNDSVYPFALTPAMCVVYKPTWFEAAPGQNLCNTPDLNIPPLPQVPLIAGFIGVNAAVTALASKLQQAFGNSCNMLGAYNWWFSMAILHSYRIDQRNRKQLIYALARNLSNSADDFVDLTGNSTKAGAQQTFLKNLTYANRNSAGITFEMMNSLGGAAPETWLPEVKISPTLFYSDLRNGPGCAATPKPIQSFPERSGAQAQLLDQNGFNAGQLKIWSQGEPPPTDAYSFSLGVEKNPWMMAYVGVRASTKPRQIFFPFGPSLTMTARAFAQPFGGRIGPWYGAQWPRGSAQSTGQMIDPLIPPRPQADGFLDSPNDIRRLPNYSRFPGDLNGLTTNLSLNSLRNLKDLGVKYNFYRRVYQEFDPALPNDVLAWDWDSAVVPPARLYELAAIAPDLFDITYYSIEPNFQVNYLNSIRSNANQLGIPANLVIRGDLGTHPPETPSYSIQDSLKAIQTENVQVPEAYYFTRSRSHLLTGWAPGEGAVNYDFPYSRFGRCELSDDGLKDKVPGSCVAKGGRTGYSVRLVSRSFLNSSQNRVGGAGIPPGALMNPPRAKSW